MNKTLKAICAGVAAITFAACTTTQGKDAMMSDNADNMMAKDSGDKAMVALHILDESESGMGQKVGMASLMASERGLEIKLTFDMPIGDGSYGFHIHEGTSVAPAEKDGKMVVGLAAKSHYDPTNTGVHEGPEGNGHLGDLPLLTIKNGQSSSTLLAPRIMSLADIYGRVLMIHKKGDNYSDTPAALGGGGARYIGGIIERQ